MKRIRFVVSFISVIIFAFSFCAAAYSENMEGSFLYSVDEKGTGCITRYNGNDNIVTVPSEIDGIKITAIGNGAFKSCRSLQEVMIPEGIEIIDSFAFTDCSQLISVSLPESLLEIRNNAFDKCMKLQEIVLPDNLQFIGDFAFDRCLELERINIPQSVTYIGANPFTYCEKRIAVRVDPGHPCFAMIDGALYSKADRRLICVPASSNGEIRIPNGVKSIGEKAFYSFFQGLIDIPDSVEEIANVLFLNDNTTLVVSPGSVAEAYAIENDISYLYPDAADLSWLD